ncbi:hypothetical protein Q6A51_18780 [Pseudomonas sp. KFB-139]|uniref:Type 1 fimbrial protein n=1 Tax=Pseudomonas serbiensis TaxID=3064350 RepID=A0ABT9CXQ6_9PSED|nr:MULTISPECIES: hypothetical protein [Pseudomonas]MDO7928836.1 hypothetical protein [Pseudomonas sp. KFB-138]
MTGTASRKARFGRYLVYRLNWKTLESLMVRVRKVIADTVQAFRTSMRKVLRVRVIFLAVNPFVDLTEICQMIKRSVAMKSEASVCRCFLEALSKARRVAAAMVIPGLFLAVPVTVQAEALRFHGKVVNTGCDIVQAAAVGPGNDVRYVQVSGITFQMSTSRNACSDKAIPFSTQYQVLSSTSLQATLQNQSKNQTGLLIITYQ